MKISRILRISRPFLWSVGPIIFLVPFVYFRTFPNFIALIQMFMLTFPFCFFLFGINDIFDYETDRINPRKGGNQGAVLRKREFRIVYIISIFVALIMVIVSLMTVDYVNFMYTVLLLFFSYFYSAKPIRLKELPPLDSITNAVIIYLIGALGYSYFSSGFFPAPHGITRDLLLLLLALVTIHTFSTISDYSPDKKAKVRTFATVFGKKSASAFSIILMIIVILLLQSHNFFINIFLFSSVILYSVPFIINSEKTAKHVTIFQFFFFYFCAVGFFLTV